MRRLEPQTYPMDYLSRRITMEDKPATKFSGETLVTVLVICLLIIGLFFIGFRYSERDQGALIIPGAVQQGGGERP